MQRTSFGSRHRGGLRRQWRCHICRDQTVHALPVHFVVFDARLQFLDRLPSINAMRGRCAWSSAIRRAPTNQSSLVGCSGNLDSLGWLHPHVVGHVLGIRIDMQRLAFSIGLAAFVTGCGLGSSAQESFEVLNNDSKSLRRAFNADRGKVRVLMLVSPT